MQDTTTTTPSTTDILVNKDMFIFDIKHTESKSASLFKVAHEDCFKREYKIPNNYVASVERQATNARATCEFCGERLNPVEAAREEAAIAKWLATGNRDDYTQVISERNKRDGKAVRVPYVRPMATVTGRMSSTSPNISASPQSDARNVLAKLKGVKAVGVESDGVRIVTHQEQSISDMSKLSDEELFNKE